MTPLYLAEIVELTNCHILLAVGFDIRFKGAIGVIETVCDLFKNAGVSLGPSKPCHLDPTADEADDDNTSLFSFRLTSRAN